MGKADAGKTFDPAPIDRLAEDKHTAIRKDKEESLRDSAVKDTFPASDPVSAQQQVLARDGDHRARRGSSR
ncbi:hypothetical protein [Bradyrhizobium sp. WD16]|uniref:hypothetical protein n=1 Tax=Bradyrhizobium sp. WD16 TaxID=1521768 RepID=UPI0020A4E72B|nr:hypothetical protein [Bradyrhizobium sp. WD16]UTD30474.1 hypothetical protein DB459_15935 [Bradyrhizobium sp. WD16]